MSFAEEKERGVLERGRKRAKEIGLVWRSFSELSSGTRYPGAYFADDIHRLFGDGAEVNAHVHASLESTWISRRSADADSTHSALLIDIRPLVQESEEHKLLRQAINLMDALGYSERVEKFAKDVRACLDKRGV